MKLEINEPVTILRGGIDGFPQVNLAGVPGRICTTHSSALPGMVSVWVDWSKTRYADIDDLPNVINNFPADLGPAQVLAAKPQAKPQAKKRPVFHLQPLTEIKLEPEEAPENTSARPADDKTSDDSGEDQAPPMLRLV